jgi:hypothetical protein
LVANRFCSGQNEAQSGFTALSLIELWDDKDGQDLLATFPPVRALRHTSCVMG